MILNGLGGKMLSEQHIKRSAQLMNASQPDYLSTLVVNFPPGGEEEYAKNVERVCSHQKNGEQQNKIQLTALVVSPQDENPVQGRLCGMRAGSLGQRWWRLRQAQVCGAGKQNELLVFIDPVVGLQIERGSGATLGGRALLPRHTNRNYAR